MKSNQRKQQGVKPSKRRKIIIPIDLSAATKLEPPSWFIKCETCVVLNCDGVTSAWAVIGRRMGEVEVLSPFGDGPCIIPEDCFHRARRTTITEFVRAWVRHSLSPKRLIASDSTPLLSSKPKQPDRIAAAYDLQRDPRGLVTWESEFVVEDDGELGAVVERHKDDSVSVVSPHCTTVFHIEAGRFKPAGLGGCRRFFAQWRARSFTNTRVIFGKAESPSWN